MVGRRTYALGTTTRSIVSQRGMTEDGPTAGRYHLPPALSSAFQLGMESPVSALVLGRGLLLEILDVDLLDLLNKLIKLATLQQA